MLKWQVKVRIGVAGWDSVELNVCPLFHVMTYCEMGWEWLVKFWFYFIFYGVEMLLYWNCRGFLVSSFSFLCWLFLLLFYLPNGLGELFMLFTLKVRNTIKTVWIMDWIILFLFLTSTFCKFSVEKKSSRWLILADIWWDWSFGFD